MMLIIKSMEKSSPTFVGFFALSSLLLEELRNIGIHDSFRHINGYGIKEYSWYINTKGGLKGRRYDHIHSSDTLDVKKCYYDHIVRENKFSDHSAIISEFNFK